MKDKFKEGLDWYVSKRCLVPANVVSDSYLRYIHIGTIIVEDQNEQYSFRIEGFRGKVLPVDEQARDYLEKRPQNVLEALQKQVVEYLISNPNLCEYATNEQLKHYKERVSMQTLPGTTNSSKRKSTLPSLEARIFL